MTMNNPWEEINPPLKDVSARLVDHAHPLDIFWARDHVGHYLFIYESFAVDKNIKPKPELTGIEVILSRGVDSTHKGRLILILKDKVDWEMFLSLCNDLVQATSKCKNDKAALTTITHRLVRWQDFLRKVNPGILSEEEIKGLIGELLFIDSHLTSAFGIGQAIRFWQGPESLPQDFCINDCAVEVKSQLGTTKPVIKISSVEQLNTQLPNLYLYVVTLGKTTSDNDKSLNLPKLICKIRKALVGAFSEELDHFNDLLFSIGYFESERYNDFSYILTCENMFKVEDGFPRISMENINRDIVKVTYTISLHGCDKFKGTPNWMEIIP